MKLNQMVVAVAAGCAVLLFWMAIANARADKENIVMINKSTPRGTALT